MSEPWRELRVGDRIRIVRLPGREVLGYVLHPETRQLYERLVATRKVLRIREIDEDGLPWIKCRFEIRCRSKDADRSCQWEHHFLAVNDDSWEWVSRST